MFYCEKIVEKLVVKMEEINNYSGVETAVLILEKDGCHPYIHRAVCFEVDDEENGNCIDFYDEYATKQSVNILGIERINNHNAVKVVALPIAENMKLYYKFVENRRSAKKTTDRIKDIEKKFIRDSLEHCIEEIIQERHKNHLPTLLYLKEQENHSNENFLIKSSLKEPTFYMLSNKAKPSQSDEIEILNKKQEKKTINFKKDVKIIFNGSIDDFNKLSFKHKTLTQEKIKLEQEAKNIISSIGWQSMFSQEIRARSTNISHPKFIHTKKGCERRVDGHAETENAIRILLSRDRDINPKEIEYIEIEQLSQLISNHKSSGSASVRKAKKITKHCDIIVESSRRELYFFVPIKQASLALKNHPTIYEKMQKFNCENPLEKAEQEWFENRIINSVNKISKIKQEIQKLENLLLETETTMHCQYAELIQRGYETSFDEIEALAVSKISA